MNNETKEVLLTFLKGRGYLFSLFHTILGAEPTKKMLDAASGKDSLQVIRLFDSEDLTAARKLEQLLAACADADEETLERMKTEYTRLFLGPEDLIAAPWESVYTTTERALFQESTLAVRDWYRKYHYLPAMYPRVPDDHISLMMHFLSLTTEKAAAALEAGQTAECSAILEGQRLFEEKHLLNWVFRYADDMQSSRTHEFYPQFVQATADFLDFDHALIDELLEYTKALETAAL